MSEWQEISTAPKDKRVLIFIPKYLGSTVWTGLFVDGEWISSGIRISEDCQPTHWMPLPEAPK